jgi:hypothetical protein
MADVDFFDAVVKEGTGLREFLDRKFPGDDRLAAIKPKLEAPYKGYFPAGVICDSFGKRMNDWKARITYKRKAKLSYLDIMIRRLHKQGEFVLFV